MTRGKIRRSPKGQKPRETSTGTDTETATETTTAETKGTRKSSSAAGTQPARTLGRGLATRQASDERRAVLDDANADRHDIPDPVDHTGNEVENGPEVDPSDPNLSAALVDADGADMNESLGLRGEDTMELDDPEEMDEEGEEGEDQDTDMPGVGRG